ncbi:PIN domain, predicted nuclease, component of toxin-antitoxin system (plasmid) [Deinococcus geothermalis DSM 11300]|uniref:Ribonuclease VapC n=1 Tax=Deinococcus geothermalis (strain DSM 11300 / CIP 105573 / AG-3a) TaxID=319795 RepID=Q1J2Y4_DEIGD|nr:MULTISPECIES: type II toxin-antitoxin system VapC family toxin [Deinococcus]ABF44150.1 PIN domain, predicted nuclease, component of toxin-antitoxin system [Deinococcus geothermalis DSM 11300]MBI0446726.1 PIN domain-containing protein [Deinococcus sp. DB0503]
MTVAYLDSSAFAKLYLDEPGREAVEALVGETGRVAACAIAYAEVRGVLARYLHQGRLTEEEYEGANEAFEADWGTTNVVDLTPALLRLAGDLLRAHAELRAMDALHLAAALEVRMTEELRFLTFNLDLGQVAQALMPGAY